VTGWRGLAALLARQGTALIVPVLDAEPAVAAWLGQDSVAFDGAPLHVTVMYPFLPARSLNAGALNEIVSLAGSIAPFGFSLERLGTFPGVQYLAPEPAAAFTEITARIQRRWPSCQPYGGAYEAVTPHVTVAFGDGPPASPADLERALPIRTRADELWLIRQGVRGWRTWHRFALGPKVPPGGQPLPPK
jgi:2'-5' RNA ligase